MKLTFNILLYQLQQKLPVKIISRNKCNILVDRPMIYSTSANLHGHVVLCSSQTIPAILEDPGLCADSIFITVGAPDPTYCITNVDFLQVQNESSFENILNTLQNIFAVFDHWEISMNEIVYENRSFTDLVDFCDPIISYPVSIVDSYFMYVAYSQSSNDFSLVDHFVDSNNSIPLDYALSLISDPEYSRTEAKHDIFTFTFDDNLFLNINLFYQGERIGQISSLCPVPESTRKYQEDVLLLISLYAEKLYARYGSFRLNDFPSSTFHVLLQNHFKGKSVPLDEWQDALNKIEWGEEDELQLFQFRPNHRYDKQLYAKYICPEIEQLWDYTYAIEYEHNIIVLMNSTRYTRNNTGDFHQELVYFLRESLLIVGISRLFKGIVQLNAALSQTNIALELGSKKDPMFWYLHFNDYAFDYLLLHGIGSFSPPQICAESLLILKKHDSKSQTEYYKTLWTYFQCHFNAAQTAAKLFVHRSTFLNRLDRIMELTRINLDSFQSRTYLSLSFLILNKHNY
ncbi:MAG: PucR family transcriptional regulator [Lachnospiraceae bacterium]